MPESPEREAPLPLIAVAAVWLTFGIATSWLIRMFDLPGVTMLVKLGLASGTAATFAAIVWFFALGIRRSALWGVAMLVPYINLIAASRYARLYWSAGAWAPASLAIAGMVVQTAATLGLLLAPETPTVI